MKIDKYKEASENLAKAIDVAVETLKKKPPKDFDEAQTLHFANCYLKWKEDALNPEPQFRNLSSLKYVVEDVFTYFQEGHGECVEEFWKEIKAQNLPYKRENKMIKIIRRKKIKDIHEYDFVIDVIVPYEQEGFINHDEVILLNDLTAQFETGKRK
ncbi:hypothetical protein [Flavobacterium sp. LC2016-12]|uniref:hypothetical protein n=1 Tax=Flavobacterium sp. LC2016-12 TaxID=2783794 RepID=UPI00188BF05C|nr:hypothetical protein [Flavobacterium sp. LC2016-12]MBF4466833.1 hypothetical protein [Flavobacterium sp. LC2016-12]